MMRLFIVLTILAFLLRVFGLDWLASLVAMPEPEPLVQAIIKAGLKAFELVFVYKILTKRSFVLCTIISLAQCFVAGFVPVGTLQSCFDLFLWIAIPLTLRKDKLKTIVDEVLLYAILTAYAALTLIGKFGELESSQVYSFYKNVASMIDYKLFIVTLYLFIKKKGGIKLWKTKNLFLNS